MDDLHQVNTIIATTICEFFKGHPDVQIGTEEAKLLAKQIAQALDATRDKPGNFVKAVVVP